MDLSINFKNKKKKIKIDTQIHTQKLNFFLILNDLIRNLQEICKILKPKKSNSNLNLCVFLGAYVWF